MRSWTRPTVTRLPGTGSLPSIHDTATDTLVETAPDALANLYVCGITPYDATHIGHAATFIAYDTLVRLWLDAGYDVSYVQNVTDVDDPLLERATATGVDWRDLAAQQMDLFRGDMEALSVIPPDHYIAVTETITPVAEAVKRLLDSAVAYRVDDDIYFDISAAQASSPWYLGQESGLDPRTMLDLAAERGGDPDRAGKRDPLDPLLWRAARDGEPSWASVVGEGRPGWHIECSVIAEEYLDFPLTVNGGASDLIFPHHEFTAAHTAAVTGQQHSRIYSHAGLVAYQGEKMSKSLGNLVLVSELVREGEDPRAIRLAILAEHYRRDWEWTDAALDAARDRLASWQAWATAPAAGPGPLLDELRAVLAYDLDTAAGIRAIDAHVADGRPATTGDLDAIAALLGIQL